MLSAIMSISKAAVSPEARVKFLDVALKSCPSIAVPFTADTAVKRKCEHGEIFQTNLQISEVLIYIYF